MSQWPLIELGELAADEPNSFVDGPFGSDMKTSDYVDAGVPLIRIQNVRPNHFLSKEIRFISEAKARRLARHQYRPGDLVITKLGEPCGVACVVPESAGSGVIVADVVRFRGDKKRIDHRYLSHFINSPTAASWVAREAKGTTRQRVNLSNFRRLPVPLPPLPEQRRIAEILDKADALRAKRRAALAQLDTLTQSIFLDMFGDPATNPKGLARIALGDVADVGTGGTPSRDVDGYFGGGIPWVKTTEVQGNVICRTEETLTDAGLRAIRGKLYPADSIIIAMYGQGKTRGQCALLGIEAAVNQACAVVRPNPEFNSRFMLVQLRLAYERLRSLGRGGNQENLNLELVRSFRLFLPPVEEQRNFVSRINAIDHVQALANSSLDALHAAFTSLQYRAFRGEI